MYNPRHKTDESLRYVSQDCLDTIRANPEGHKTEEYLATVRAIRKEQNQRDRVRLLRRIAKYSHDILLFSLRYRKHFHVQEYQIERARNAEWTLGYWRLQKKEEKREI